MQFSSKLLLAVGALSQLAAAHYRFEQLDSNTVWQYIRENTSGNSPVTDLASNDLRCNVGATGDGVETATVSAGDTVEFTLDTAVYHQGPVMWYLGMVPSGETADTWDGSGANWFKFYEIGPDFSAGGGGSATWPEAISYSATLPSALPDGDYLLRIEQLALHNPGAAPQFYLSCAQLTVTGGGSGTPTPTVNIPGHIQSTDPGYTVNIYDPSFTSYTFPGPTVWDG